MSSNSRERNSTTVMEDKLIQRLEAAVARLESLSIGSQSRELEVDTTAASTDPSIIAFDEFLTEYVGKVTAAAAKIGGQVQDVTNVLSDAFTVQKELLIKIKQTKKPDMAGLGEFLKPLNENLMKAISMTEGRRSDFFNHLKAVAESLTALAWIAYAGKDCGMSMPIAHVEESWQAAEFYNNKVLVEYRNKDSNHVEWARALKELYVPGLRNYVKSHYPLGPVWSATGSAASAPPKAPAPPPPPPASLFSPDSSQPSSSRPKEGMAAVFQEISSKPVTAGLRKVTDDMKTKNRADRAGFVSAGEKEVRPSVPTVSKVAPPKFELQVGRKWVVENQIGNKNLLIDKCDSKQTVYIFGCKDSVIQIKGKVNNITVDKCTKVGVVFTDVVAACEIVNCNSVEVQCQGTAPTISVDNSAGCQLYLSKDSLEASITTAKSSEINVLVPASGPDNDLVEHALPQQYIHSYKNGQFVTTPVSHSGG
ncbi:cyclase-associated protein 1-like [Bidens hawaiensis]|uniref:cyclase-associated protein 1-like n=1 Tax=Bidens hawaiensis TaxID=980011 RepID=UPI004048F1CF